MSYLRTFLPALLLTLLLACSAPMLETPESAFVATAPVHNSAQTAYYVAPDGDDANLGTESRPWATIQHAADVLTPGDTVYVRAGTYAEDVEAHVSGSATGGVITFRNYPGETPVLDGAKLTVPPSHSGLFYVENQSYIIIQGFDLRNYQSDAPDIVPVGIHIRGNSHHIKLLDNHIHDIASMAPVDDDLMGRDAHGIAVYGDDAAHNIHNILIKGNELDHLTLGSSESLALNGNVTDFIVRGNLVHDNDNIGIVAIGFEETSSDPATDQARDGVISDNVVYNIDTLANPSYGGDRSADGIYVDGGMRILIERNRVHHCNIGIELASEHKNRATSFVTVRNNLVYQNHTGGLSMGGYDRHRGRTEDCAIVNNTFFQNDTARNGNGEIALQFDARRNIIANNILYANDQGYLITNPYTENVGNRVDANLYFSPIGENSEWQWRRTFYQGFSAWQSGSGNDAHGLFADPIFVNAVSPDLQLQAASPAIDAADASLAPDADFLDVSRPQGSGDDIGAYEYQPNAVYLPRVIMSARTQSNAAQMLIPLYSCPSDEDGRIWKAVADAAAQVNIAISWGIICAEDDYTGALQTLGAAGVKRLAYVATSDSKRPLDEVESEIAFYARYPIDGYFFDEVSHQTQAMTYNESIIAYARSQSEDYIIALNSPYADADFVRDASADKVVIFENSFADWLAFEAYDDASLPPARLAALAHSAASGMMRQAVDMAVQRGIGFIYVTDRGWDQLPTYFQEEVAYIAQM